MLFRADAPDPLDGRAEGEQAIEIFSFLFGEILDGRNAHLADGVQRALGREPRDFRDFVKDAAVAGTWANE